MKRLLKDPLSLVIITVFVVLTTGFIGYLVHNHLAENRLFKTQGVETQATLIDMWEQEHHTTGTRPRTSYTYHARVEFPLDGQTIRASAQVSARFQTITEIGAIIPVTYIASDPEHVRIDPRYLTRQVGFFWVLLLFLAAGVFYQARSERPRTMAKSKPLPPQPTRTVQTPRWAKIGSAALMIAFFVSFFTLSIWLKNAVEDATFQTIGWFSMPLSLVAYFIPQLIFGFSNVAMSGYVARRYRS